MDLLKDERGIPNKEVYNQILNAVKNRMTGLRCLFKNKITEDDAKALPHIYIKGATLENLKFLKYFTNLEELSLTECEITSMEGIHYASKLQYLFLYDTGVKDMRAIQNCHQLEMFEYIIEKKVQYKRSSFDEIRNLDNLWEVDLTNNNIEDLSFLRHNRKLKEVVISGNPINNLESLQVLPNMTWLEVEDCQLESLDEIEAMPSLCSLFATDNRLTEQQKESYEQRFGHFKDLDL